jgi:hypothetical protein
MEELQTAQYLTFHISSYGEVVNNSVPYSERYKPPTRTFSFLRPPLCQASADNFYFKGAQAWDFLWRFLCINQALLGHRIRISSEFDFIQKFTKILKFLKVMRCLSIRLVTMCVLSAEHKHIVTTRMLSITVIKVKNYWKFMLMLSQCVVTVCLCWANV